MKHIRFILLAYVVLALVSIPLLTIGAMLVNGQNERDAFLISLIMLAYTIPLVVISFFLYRFILSFLKEKKQIKLPFWKRMLIMIFLGIVYSIFTYVVSLSDGSLPTTTILLFFATTIGMYIYLGLIYELTAKIAEKKLP